MDDFAVIDARLRRILEPYRARLVVSAEGPGGMTVEIPGLEGKPWGYVAGTRVGKRYVSFYAMLLYGSSAAAAAMSPELKRRMQGKACFNFTKVDEPLFAELARLLEAGVAPFVETARQMDAERRSRAGASYMATRP